MDTSSWCRLQLWTFHYITEYRAHNCLAIHNFLPTLRNSFRGFTKIIISKFKSRHMVVTSEAVRVTWCYCKPCERGMFWVRTRKPWVTGYQVLFWKESSVYVIWQHAVHLAGNVHRVTQWHIDVCLCVCCQWRLVQPDMLLATSVSWWQTLVSFSNTTEFWTLLLTASTLWKRVIVINICSLL